MQALLLLFDPKESPEVVYWIWYAGNQRAFEFLEATHALQVSVCILYMNRESAFFFADFEPEAEAVVRFAPGGEAYA